MNNDKEVTGTAVSPASKRPWIAPAVLQLPRLTELTLQSFAGEWIGGGGGSGGSTVF